MTVPGVLLPYQERWNRDPSPVKVIEKSRRIGLSWAEAEDSVNLAARKPEAGGMDVFYCGYNKDMAREFIDDCAYFAKVYNVVAGEVGETVFRDVDKDILTFEIRFASGFRIAALSSRPSNFRGKQGKAIIDEAAFHDDLGELIKAAMAFLMWGGRVSIISTHDGEESEFNTLIQDIRSGRKNYSLHRVTLDDALREGLFKRICARLGRKWTPEAEAAWRQELIDFYGDGADDELFCIPSQGSGVFMPSALVSKRMSPDYPVVRLALPDSFIDRDPGYRTSYIEAWCQENLAHLLAGLDPKRRTWFGQDFGRTGDLSSIFPIAERQNATYYTPFILEMRNVTFDQQREILFYIADRLPRFTRGALDSRGNGQYLGEVARQRYGAYRIDQVMQSEPWYREHMPPYKAAFEDGSLTIPKDADVLDDHRALRMVRGVARVPDKRTTGSDKGKRHGDTALAGALGWSAVQSDAGGPIEYETTGVKRAYTGLTGYMGV